MLAPILILRSLSTLAISRTISFACWLAISAVSQVRVRLGMSGTAVADSLFSGLPDQKRSCLILNVKEILGTWRAKRLLKWHLMLTGFEHIERSFCQSRSESRSHFYTKLETMVCFNSFSNCIGQDWRHYVSVGRNLDQTPVNAESILAALTIVKDTFPDDKPDVVTYILKPLGYKVLVGVGGILAIGLFVNCWTVTLGFIRNIAFMKGFEVPALLLTIPALFFVISISETLFSRIALAFLWVAMLAAAVWRYLI